MNYLYHIAREQMQGNVLYPLNQLKSIYPEAYSNSVKKYLGREHILKEKIPPLKCLWNDVLHLTAVHPSVINKALKKAGAKKLTVGFYQINPKSLEKEKTVVYTYNDMSRINRVQEKEFIPFQISNLSEYSEISDKTIEYYKEVVALNKRPLIFHGVPHILYKGNIDITDLPII